jgi:hypothetical protein
VAIADIPDLGHNFFKGSRPAIAFVKHSMSALTKNNTRPVHFQLTAFSPLFSLPAKSGNETAKKKPGMA